MNRHFARGLMGAGLLGCAIIWAVPGGAADPKGGLDEADAKAVMEFNAKILQDTLAQAKVPKPMKLRAATAAKMVALAAQSGGGAKNAQLATIRDAALRIALAIENDKLDEARAQTKDLMSMKADENAKLDAVAIMDKQLKLDDIMNQYAGERGGGLAIEDKLEEWDDKGLPEKLDKVVETADQMYTVFEAVRGHAANTKLGTQAEWDKFSDQARSRAQELRDAAKKGDKVLSQKALVSVMKSCEECHKTFRPR